MLRIDLSNCSYHCFTRNDVCCRQFRDTRQAFCVENYVPHVGLVNLIQLLVHDLTKRKVVNVYHVFVCLSVSLSVCRRSVGRSVGRSVSLVWSGLVWSVLSCLSVCPSVLQSVCPSVRQSVCPSVHLSIYPSIHLSSYPSFHLSILRPSVRLSVYLMYTYTYTP